jgi:hypothetical protein
MAKKKLNKDEAFRILWNNGFFFGWDKIEKEYQPDANEAAEYKSFLFKMLLKKILEAKKEIQLLEVSINRMESICRAGTSLHQKTGPNPWDNNQSYLMGELRAFNGWFVSLFESHQTLIQYIQNPDSARMSFENLRAGMAELAGKRAQEQSLFAKSPEFFSLTMFYP